ncbi:MAG: Lrp/AsnC family transcriptional regulator [Firmicutes bacterium]|jgi:Lrp/AsnC family transcriptional regulator for asnA, asnC and gidA|nr:Lrp/AsnC family transcriptional regulator [Bacillota bacterium]
MAKYVLDDTDREIIELLQQDGRMPFLTIANQLGLAEGTVRRRVARLLDEGILRIVGITDPFRIGLYTVAIVGLKVERGRIDPIANALAELPEVRSVALSTGNFDLVIQVAVKNNDELLTFLIKKLSEIPGILNTGTSLVLKVAKEDFGWGVN